MRETLARKTLKRQHGLLGAAVVFPTMPESR
jgi:hypothetical protein